ncbi:transporter substrate-binding domain-containing protein [Affinirhizobium pseudoryzae]|uniref:transporter substrate-binding domain-containing protein n=1 Tax=Allorhizobium pseudoryzae TaxID=379684 RepID=UPI0013ED314F|nr:transporter substrate-binding domain-containing protein [Allorhizobium pseudoryzae]
MYFRFRAALLFLLVLIAGLPAAADETPDRQMPLVSDPNERLAKPDLTSLPRFRVLTTVDFPPFSFVDQTGRLSGFHIDLVREICSELTIEAKCQIQVTPFADLQTALSEGQGEAAAAGIAVTPDLREKFGFSRPYMMIPAWFVQRNSVELEGKAAVALAGRPVGVVAGTAHEAMLKSFFPAVKPTTFPSRDEMLAALKDGKVDAVFSDGLSLPFWTASAAAGGCCRLFDGPYVSEHFLGEGLSLMVRPDVPQLVTAIDYALARLAKEGRLQELYLRYFPNGLF